VVRPGLRIFVLLAIFQMERLSCRTQALAGTSTKCVTNRDVIKRASLHEYCSWIMCIWQCCAYDSAVPMTVLCLWQCCLFTRIY